MPKANATSGEVPPVLATSVIGRDGRIKFTCFNPDYCRRISVRRVAAAL
ncbi:hypothetical protein [Hymenobacter antarcticus]|uniref:Uncharacterized protein n=1 Tax=Hymenobacter antarcticus TaxID=486270 RepID=A0ABP7PPK2_9BACT